MMKHAFPLLFFFLAFPLTSAAAAQSICDQDNFITALTRRLTALEDILADDPQDGLTELQAINTYVGAYHDTCTDATPAAPITTLYTGSSRNVNVRASASATAQILGVLPPGSSVSVYSTTTGDVVSGSREWYEVDYNGQTGYIHSSLLAATRPVAQPTQPPAPPVQQPPAQPTPQPVIQPTQPPAPPAVRRPANCAEAVAMGLSAVEAAQWPHLDRDKDGVACYGD